AGVLGGWVVDDAGGGPAGLAADGDPAVGQGDDGAAGAIDGDADGGAGEAEGVAGELAGAEGQELEAGAAGADGDQGVAGGGGGGADREAGGAGGDDRGGGRAREPVCPAALTVGFVDLAVAADRDGAAGIVGRGGGEGGDLDRGVRRGVGCVGRGDRRRVSGRPGGGDRGGDRQAHQGALFFGAMNAQALSSSGLVALAAHATASRFDPPWPRRSSPCRSAVEIASPVPCSCCVLRIAFSLSSGGGFFLVLAAGSSAYL